MNKQFSFPRQNRLTTKAEYKTVFDNASKIRQRHFLILFRPNQKTYARLGIIVGKRVAKEAVARNQIKRIVRDSFRQIQKKLSGLNIIFIAQQQCDTLSKRQLREGLDKLWEKLITQSSNASLS